MTVEKDNRQGEASMADVEKTMSAIEGVVRILGPLASDERQRVVQGALVILRESVSKPESLDLKDRSTRSEETVDISARARLWAKQNDLSDDQLSHVFDVSDGVVTVIASGISGKNNSTKTIKAYVLSGIASLLSSGDPVFSDKDARSLCENFGCYDNTNHSRYMKDKANYFVGDKDKGWKLTAPGLKFGGAIVKELLA